MDYKQQLEQEYRRQTCTLCSLHKERSKVVWGVGPRPAKIMCVGRNPGPDEDEKGKPFVGKSGSLLDKIWEKVGLERTDLFISNAAKCYSKGNRPPTSDEFAMCQGFHALEFFEVRPLVVVTLGKDSFEAIAGRRWERSTRGTIFEQEWRGFKYQLIPSYHPGLVLRSGRERARDALEAMVKDWREVAKIVEAQATSGDGNER